MEELNPAFCPICNKDRKRPLTGSILVSTEIEGIAKCGICKRLFQQGKEVLVEVKEKPKPGEDLRKYIPDWYRCPLCREVIAGFSSWAAHCWQKHGLNEREFEQKYGEPEKSYYGIAFQENFNPSER